MPTDFGTKSAQCRHCAGHNAGIVLNTMLDTMPAQYRHNACKMPVHCRHCVDKILAQCLCNSGTIPTLRRHNAKKSWHNVSAMPAQCQCNAGTVLAQFWPSIGTMVAQCRKCSHNTVTMLLQCWKNTGTTLAQCWQMLAQCWHNNSTLLELCRSFIVVHLKNK
jgi:hypothetical protein